MINPRIFREAENASANYNHTKGLDSAQKLPKKKALGDVQNTLHSRPGNFSVPKFSPSAKINAKPLSYGKATSGETGLSMKNSSSGGEPHVTPFKYAVKTVSAATPSIDDIAMLDIHDHALCEQENESYASANFKDYMLSDKQIENLVRSVKVPTVPLLVEIYKPCEDIEIPPHECEESFTIDDIFSDIVLPDIPPPLMVL